MAFPAFIAALPAPQLFGLAGETTGGTTHHITDTAALAKELEGARELAQGLTQAPTNHLDRVFRGGLKTAAAGAIRAKQPVVARAPTNKGFTLG